MAVVDVGGAGCRVVDLLLWTSLQDSHPSDFCVLPKESLPLAVVLAAAVPPAVAVVAAAVVHLVLPNGIHVVLPTDLSVVVLVFVPARLSVLSGLILQDFPPDAIVALPLDFPP